ncbi:hypothetical protein [Cryobacterium breve]|uniref:hypothetical protein n=1 Tax=Cryobacterium breve TaxID=1259258 RepID=UPI00248D02AB|nr:hypothetical protein [Cryobacterium breve]
MLDTHDGIGVIDAGPAGGRPGLLSEAEMAEVFARAAEATHGHSSVASVVPEWATLPHQINATFFSTLGGDVVAYLVARAVQHFLPGRPQTYYVGLLGGLDDREALRRNRQRPRREPAPLPGGGGRGGARERGDPRPARPRAAPLHPSRVRRPVHLVDIRQGRARACAGSMRPAMPARS